MSIVLVTFLYALQVYNLPLSVILLSNGDVLGFGSNAAGQLGLGNVNLAHVPTKMG